MNYYWIALIIFCSMLGAGGQILFKVGVDPVSIKPLLFGGMLYGLSLILYLIALREVPLHIGYSMIALSYIWVMLLSFIVLREPITKYKVFGSIGIVGSVLLISVA